LQKGIRYEYSSCLQEDKKRINHDKALLMTIRVFV